MQRNTVPQGGIYEAVKNAAQTLYRFQLRHPMPFSSYALCVDGNGCMPMFSDPHYPFNRIVCLEGLATTFERYQMVILVAICIDYYRKTKKEPYTTIFVAIFKMF
jgi:hypothetical protein